MHFNLQVDCTANTNTCNKYGVSGYPTLKIFRDGEEAGAYDGPRTAGKDPQLHSKIEFVTHPILCSGNMTFF